MPSNTDYAVAPAEFLLDHIQDRQTDPMGLAFATGAPLPLLAHVLLREPLDERHYGALETATGIPARFWWRLEVGYRDDLVRLNIPA